MNKYLKFIWLKLNNKTVLTSSFLNTIKIKTIQPDVRLSYNQLFNNVKQTENARHRTNTEPTLEISKH